MKRRGEESEPAAATAAAVTSFAPEMMTQRDGVGGIRGCLQPITGQQRHTLPPALHCVYVSIPLPPLLYLVLVRGFHGSQLRLGRPATEQHVKSGNGKAARRWQG